MYKLKTDITPLSDHIIAIDMEVGEKITRGGIILTDDNGKEHGIRPRWCQIYKVGKNVDYVKAGEWVLVEHGRWTHRIEMETENGSIFIQRLDPEAILMVADEKPEQM